MNDIVDNVADETPTTDVEEVQADEPETEEEIVGEEEAEAELDGEEASEETEEGDEETQPISETVKVEYDGEEYEVPTKIKDALMMNKDYTQKTQSLAEQRKAMEAEQADFAQYVEATKANSQHMANLAAIDQQLEAFNNYDWNAAYDADIHSATKLRHQAEQLQNHRNQLVQEIDRSEQERLRMRHEHMARTAQRTDEQLKAEIPNWGDELKADLGNFAVKELGLPASMVSQAVTPQEIKTLYYAQIGLKTLNDVKAKSVKSAPPKKVQPSKSIAPKRQKAPTDLSKITDPEAYAKAYRKQYGR